MKKTKRVICMVLAVLCVSSFTGCLKYTSNILEVTTAPSYTPSSEAPYTSYNPASTQPDYTQIPTMPLETTSGMGENVPTTEIPSTTLPVVTEPYATVPSTEAEAPQTQAPVTEAPATEEAVKDPSQWSKAEILSFLTNSMNKSRMYTAAVSAHHTEDFSFNVSEVTGGDIVKNLANKIIGSIAEPSDETLNFNGGQATNSEGETVAILLPKKGNFFIDESGCTSISASKNGANTEIKLTLIKESVDMTSIPKYNSSCCGYLDISTLDLSILTITSFNIDYQATEITYIINPDGYVTKASYHVPLALDAAGKSGFISANVKASGYEDEVWELNW